MFDAQEKLEVSPEQLRVIEAALHTQSKILHVQAQAGGPGARERLNEVKSLLTKLAQQKPADPATDTCRPIGWFGFSKSFL